MTLEDVPLIVESGDQVAFGDGPDLLTIDDLHPDARDLPPWARQRIYQDAFAEALTIALRSDPSLAA